MGYQVSLRAARVNQNLRRIDASKSIGVSDRTLYNWESGKSFPPADMLLRLCELYKVPIDNIFIPRK